MLIKIINKLGYLLMIIFLKFLYAFVWVLIKFPKKVNSKLKKDILLLPYYPKGCIGDVLRFSVYKPYLEKNDINYCISYVSKDAYLLNKLYSRPIFFNFFLYIKIYIIRITQILSAYKYKVVFVQRALFPYYPDKQNLLLYKLLKKYNSNAIIDFYDADYIANLDLIKDSVKYFKVVSVVNKHLEKTFSEWHNNVKIFPLALDNKNYIVKKKYTINKEIRLIWTGDNINFQNIINIKDELIKLSKQYIIKLIIISFYPVSLEGIDLEWHPFEQKSFFKILSTGDIALYPAKDDEIHRGKMAMKVLEYMASALPIVANPWGISPFLEENKDVLLVNNISEWFIQISNIIKSQEIRETIGQNGYKKFIEFHCADKSFNQFLDIIDFNNKENLIYS